MFRHLISVCGKSDWELFGKIDDTGARIPLSHWERVRGEGVSRVNPHPSPLPQGGFRSLPPIKSTIYRQEISWQFWLQWGSVCRAKSLTWKKRPLPSLVRSNLIISSRLKGLAPRRPKTES